MSLTKSISLKDGTPLDPLILHILQRRGLSTEKEIRSFLEPELKDLPSPFLMQDMEIAASTVGDAVMNGESILIWGDYDVDGATSTALLLLFLKGIGVTAHYYIPNRLTEGYGLQSKVLERVTRKRGGNADILITVDNGISAHDAVRTACELGYKVIVTDHHTPPESRVNAKAVLNPRQKACSFPGKNLAGVGVAFYLLVAVRNYLSRKDFFNSGNPAPNLKQFLDLVSVGTVADMVELDDINRILVRAGMETLADRSNQGLTALCKQTNLDCGMIRAEDISFQLAPKINAAGRLGFADRAVSLLTCQSKSESRQLAASLLANNEKRKVITLENLADAIDEVSADPEPLQWANVVSGHYHIGVAGIVASNLVEKYKKPAVVLCEQGNGTLKGSARSVEGVNLYDALKDCSKILLGFGGHAMAAGMSLRAEDLTKFKTLFAEAVRGRHTDRLVEEDAVPLEISVPELFTAPVLRQLLLLEPHGTGNPQPLFSDPSVCFGEICAIGRDKTHLRLTIAKGKTEIKGIAFGMGELAEECRDDTQKAIVYSPSLNFFRGKRNWQVRVIGITFKP